VITCVALVEELL
jgi:hypothetical protein